MATAYTPDTVAEMTAEFRAVAEELGLLDLIPTGPGLVDDLLGSSRRWAESNPRALGPFGAFLAGTVAGTPVTEPLAAVDRMISGLATGSGTGSSTGSSTDRRRPQDD